MKIRDERKQWVLSPVITGVVTLMIASACGKAPSASSEVPVDYERTQREVMTIDLSAKCPEKDVYLQDFADIRYVPLETDSRCVMNYPGGISIRDGYIIVKDGMGRQVLVYDSDGRYISKVSSHGAGPHEYQILANSPVDFDNMLIYVEDVSGFKVYDFDGYWVRFIPKPDYATASQLYLYDSDRLLAHYEASKSYIADSLKGNYYFIDLKTGARTLAGIQIDDPASNSRVRIEGAHAIASSIPVAPMLKTGGRVVVSDYVTPEVYEGSPSGLDVIMDRHGNGKGVNDGRFLSSVAYLTDRYVVIRAIRTVGEEEVGKDDISEIRSLIYDRKEGKMFEGGILNRDMDVTASNLLAEGWGHDLPENTFIDIISVEGLQRLNDKGRLHGKLKEIADTISDDANPVLMIATIRK